MSILEAICLDLPRRRANWAHWDDPTEFGVYMVSDIVALDWEVEFPNGRIIEDFEYAEQYQQEELAEASVFQFKGNKSGSSGTA